jgi:hypothetical protein
MGFEPGPTVLRLEDLVHAGLPADHPGVLDPGSVGVVEFTATSLEQRDRLLGQPVDP